MRKTKKIILVIIGIIALIGLYGFVYEPTYNGLVKTWEPNQIIAHRGFGNGGPDNSLVAAKMAIESNMAGIDVDGQLSSDGELVIFHDLSVDRLTDGEGRVGDLSKDDLLALDLGPHFGEGFEGSFVSTFEDFLVAMKGKGIFMVELKVTTAKPTGIEERAVEIIQKHNAHDFVMLSSFNPLVLKRLKKLDSNVKTVFIFMDTNWNPALLAEIKTEDLVNLPWFLRQEFIRVAIRKIVKPDLLSVNHEVNEKTISKLINKGYPIFLWTPNDEASLAKVIAKQPFGIISDEPILAEKLLK